MAAKLTRVRHVSDKVVMLAMTSPDRVHVTALSCRAYIKKCNAD